MITTKNTAYYLQVVFLALVIGIGLQIASAWTPPNNAPPTQSVTAPLTTGAVSQSKLASLNLTGNLGAFEVQINSVVIEGSACTATGRIARDTNGVILSCQSSVWTKAGGSASAVAIANFNMLPVGSHAGQCVPKAISLFATMPPKPATEPAYHTITTATKLAVPCSCRAGFTTTTISGGSAPDSDPGLNSNAVAGVNLVFCMKN